MLKMLVAQMNLKYVTLVPCRSFKMSHAVYCIIIPLISLQIHTKTVGNYIYYKRKLELHN